jgi:predicted DNA-binding transcriptional regulator AlpA
MRWLVKSELAEIKKLPSSWTAINKLIKEEGFPPGRMCGRNRIWHEQEIDEWMLNRPTAKSFLRGRAKALVACQEVL